jgi:hypothetical protein
MSLESFFGLDDADTAGSAEAAEKFREQMQKNASAVTAMQGHQQQQQKQEDKLARLLIKLLQDPAYADLVFLIIKLLEENVPGAFIVAVLALVNAEMERELMDHLPVPQEKELEVFNSESLPDNLKKELNTWGDLIIRAGLMRPTKTLESVLTPDQKLKSLVLDLVLYSLEEFFVRHGMQFSEDRLREFALLSLQAVLIKLRDRSREISDMELVETPL